MLELCAIYRTLLADADGLYDPSHYNDRLLLGLKGTMSEAELHILKSRLQQGMWNKAERGEVLNHPPIGYVRSSSARDGLGDYVIDPDEQVQASVRMVFEQFRAACGSVNGLLRWLVRNDVKIPVRPHFGSNRGELEWRRANRVTLLNMLHHPIYAGAYRWGHREIDPRKKVPGKADHRSHVQRARRVPRADSRSFRSLHHVGGIREKPANARTKTAHWARCSPLRVTARACWPGCWSAAVADIGCWSDTPTCRARRRCVTVADRDAIDYGAEECQSLSGAALESFVVERLLQAVSPASLELSLAATADIERERKQLDDHWQQRLARSRYEVEQARRQYAAVDPDHRLVARELERRWDEALRSDEQLQADYARFQRDVPNATFAARSVNRFWRWRKICPRCGMPTRRRPKTAKRSRGCCLEQVTVTVEGNTDRVDVELRWAGGFISRHTLYRPVQTYEQLSNYDELVARIEALTCTGEDVVRDRLDVERGRLPSAQASLKIHQSNLSRFLRERQAANGDVECPHSTSNICKPTNGGWRTSRRIIDADCDVASLAGVGWVTSRKVQRRQAAAGRSMRTPTNSPACAASATAPRGWPQPYPTELITPKPKPRKARRQYPSSASSIKVLS